MDDEIAQCIRHPLMIEAFVAAGPRKSGEEYRGGAKELCEDCAGYRSIGDFIIFWICDGTSNSHELPKRPSFFGFNSRILAQDLGEGFARIMTESLMKADDPKSGLQEKLLGGVAAEWQRRLIDYLADVKKYGELEDLLEQMPEMGDGFYRMQWSSTLLGGVYNEQKQTLDIVNIGDSGAVVIGEYSKQVTPKAKNEILLANIFPGEQLKVEVCPVEVEVEWEHFEKVQCFFAMSDGLAKNLDLLLDDIEKNLESMSIDDVRRRLLMRGELTYDDQAFIIGRLMAERSEIASGSNIT